MGDEEETGSEARVLAGEFASSLEDAMSAKEEVQDEKEQQEEEEDEDQEEEEDEDQAEEQDEDQAEEQEEEQKEEEQNEEEGSDDEMIPPSSPEGTRDGDRS